MKQRSFIAIAIVVVIVACRTPSSVAPLSIPLQYKTMANPAEFPAPPACAALSKIDVRDARDEKALGKRYVEGKNTPAASVSTSSDVQAWAATGVEAALKRAGIPTNKASAPALSFTIEQISTAENVLHRAGYEAHVNVAAELRPAAGGAACWTGRVEGSSENYGYAGSTENYQETLNHALDRAVIRIISTPEVKKAICSCGG